MKTLTRTIIVLAALSVLTTAFAQAPGVSTPPPAPTPSIPTPAPVPAPTPPTLPSSGIADLVADNMFSNISFSSRSGSGDMVLVIPTEQTKTEDLLAINEDMNVMSRIFEKNLEQERIKTVDSRMFVSRGDAFATFFGGSRSEIQSMYLQGFGALFLLKVDFPLSPPPDVQEQEQETQKTEEGDPVWREIRQQMYEPEKIDNRRRTDRTESKYDAEKVENLKTTLIKALKHAVNIRNLKPEESVILTIVGGGESTGVSIVTASGAPGQVVVVQKSADGTKTQRVVQGNSLNVLEDIGFSSPAVLVIRTKKSDINEFSKGDIDFEKFRQRVKLLTYPLLGGADGHGSHFNPYMQFKSTGSSSNIHR